MEAEEALEQFQRTYGAARLNLEGVDEELALKTPGEEGNSINWIVGHILAYRAQLLRSLGAELPADDDTLAPYSPGGSSAWSPERAVPLERLRELFGESQRALSVALASPGPDEPVGPSEETDLSFFHFHEAYHVGQIALARRCLGLPGVIEPSDAPGRSR